MNCKKELIQVEQQILCLYHYFRMCKAKSGRRKLRLLLASMPFVQAVQLRNNELSTLHKRAKIWRILQKICVPFSVTVRYDISVRLYISIDFTQ